MNDAWFTRTSKNIGLIAVSLVAGLTFALALEVGYPIRTGDQPQWCSSIGPLCLAYEWQTLLGSFIAVAAAFLTIREARKQYLLTRWIEFKKMAEDYKVMQALRYKFDSCLEKMEPCLEEIQQGDQQRPIEMNAIVCFRVESASNIRKPFNPEFFDRYVSLSSHIDKFIEEVPRRYKKGELRVDAIRENYADVVNEMKVLRDAAHKAENQGQAFVSRMNKMLPKDLHLSLGLNQDGHHLTP